MNEHAGLSTTLIFLAAAVSLAFSSTAFALQILAERQQRSTSYGRTAFSTLLFQDLAAIPLIAAIPFLDASNGEHTVQWMALGSFFAGVLLPDSEYRHELEADIEPFKGLLLGLFFMVIDMTFDDGLLIHRPLFNLVVVVTLTMALTPALVAFNDRYLTKFFGEEEKKPFDAIPSQDNEVIVAAIAWQNFLHLKLFARARNREHVFRLLDLGVTRVWRETYGSSLEMAEGWLEEFGFLVPRVKKTIRRFRSCDEALLLEQHKVYQDETQLIDVSKRAQMQLLETLEADREESLEIQKSSIDRFN